LALAIEAAILAGKEILTVIKLYFDQSIGQKKWIFDYYISQFYLFL